VNLFAENYEKACKCENRGFKFIFMDLNMPEIDGFEASEHILNILKNDKNEDYCHIVALTSYTGLDVR
jgi:CheY-like chemotaxis protein